jgi:two-component system, NarL family, nitrate/nitrite response regulator NarL
MRKLSQRQIAILQCLREGNSNKLISRKLDISYSTVKVHMRALMDKLQMRSRTQLAVWAHSNLDQHVASR